ncbi:MAG: UbiX family flavin prenyltransferase [Nitrospirota bacterium]
MTDSPKYIIGISGASGVIYGINLLTHLIKKKARIYLVISSNGLSVLKEEMDLDWRGKEEEVNSLIKRYYNYPHITYFDENNLTSCIASGSFYTDGMVIIPCSMKTLAGITHGFTYNLIGRAADVIIKEKRPLILVPRETPLNEIHLSNMLALAKAGVNIIPAMPAFYHNPESIDGIVNFIVGRVLDSLKIKNDLYRRYTGKS